MARKPRIGLPGVPQHVVQRGNNRQPCFYNEHDFIRFLEILHQALLVNDCALHAFVLMTNHVHMLVTPKSGDGVTRLMRDIGRSYVRYFNDTYRRTGTLWEGRFKSSLIDSERYCLACYRYIEMNSVRARMVSEPAEYNWSSYHTNALGEPSDLITPHEQWIALGRDEHSRRQAYCALFSGQVSKEDLESIRYGMRKCLPVGGAEFRQHVETTLGIRLGTGKRGRRWKR